MIRAIVIMLDTKVVSGLSEKDLLFANDFILRPLN